MTITEDAINDLLADWLRGQGINITTQTSGRTPDGKRKPDFELRYEGSIYHGEGEWQKTYATGMTQAVNFGDIPEEAGGGHGKLPCCQPGLGASG